MRWVLMLFVILAAVMGGEARAVAVSGRVAVSEWVGMAEAGAPQESGTSVMDPASLRAYSLRLIRADGTVTRVDLLRSAGWEQVMAQGPDGRRTIHLELPEMGVSGEAEVLAVSPCPPLEPGVGREVTGCFRNERNHGLRALHVSVAGEVSWLRVMSGHPVWSVTRAAWIGAGELAAGEALAAWRGEPVAVLANLPEADTGHGISKWRMSTCTVSVLRGSWCTTLARRRRSCSRGVSSQRLPTASKDSPSTQGARKCEVVHKKPR